MFNKAMLLMAAPKVAEEGKITVTVGKWDVGTGYCLGYNKNEGVGKLSNTTFFGDEIVELRLNYTKTSSGIAKPDLAGAYATCVVSFSSTPEAGTGALLMSINKETTTLTTNMDGAYYFDYPTWSFDIAEGDVLEVTLEWSEG